MKCPKCGYLGFETSDRCRNCGYDFSLANIEPTTELPLRSAEGSGTVLADLVLGETRVVGADDPVAATEATLPLFDLDRPHDGPAITPPPARPPLSVRRTTPEIPRGRARAAAKASTGAVSHNAPSMPLDSVLATEAPPTPTQESTRQRVSDAPAAAAGPRLMAMAIDLILLAFTDAVVIYLTLALTGLDYEAVWRLPRWPLASFFLILNGGYLVAFVAASGQTIGKMAARIRVIGNDGQRVDIGGAVLRAVGCALSLLTAGLGYLPAFLTADGRALHDRISGTRVVSAR